MTKNGIEAIAGEILEDVHKEAETILLKAQNEAKDILHKAKQQADSYIQSMTIETEKTAQAEKHRLESLTEVEIRNLFLQSKENLVDEAFEKAFQEMKNFAESDNYPIYLKKLIANIAKNMNQKNLVVEVNAKDKEWLTSEVLETISKKTKVKLEFSSQTANILGGCIVESKDGKIAFDGTLDSRFNELRIILRPTIARLLFGDET